MAHELALAPHQVLRDAVPLMLLDKETEVRRSAAQALEQTADPETCRPSPAPHHRGAELVPEADRPASTASSQSTRQGGGLRAMAGGGCAGRAGLADRRVGAQSVIASSRNGKTPS